MATRIIKLQNDSYTLLPVTDAKLVQMTVDGNTKSVYDVILEDEEVTAAGYNELNDRLNTVETSYVRSISAISGTAIYSGVVTGATLEDNSSGGKNIEFTYTSLATSDPSASGNSSTFIATISQAANGKITATKKTIDLSSQSKDFGYVQSLTGDSGTGAGTSNTNKLCADAVKDTLQVKGGNKWITTGVSQNDTSETSNTDILYINHAINPNGSDKTVTTSGNSSLTHDSSLVVTGISYNVDAAGHVKTVTATTGKLPKSTIKHELRMQDSSTVYPLIAYNYGGTGTNSSDWGTKNIDMVVTPMANGEVSTDPAAFVKDGKLYATDGFVSRNISIDGMETTIDVGNDGNGTIKSYEYIIKAPNAILNHEEEDVSLSDILTEIQLSIPENTDEKVKITGKNSNTNYPLVLRTNTSNISNGSTETTGLVTDTEPGAAYYNPSLNKLYSKNTYTDLLAVPTTSSAADKTKGINFYDGSNIVSHIGASASLGLYTSGSVYIRPNNASESSPNGSVVINNTTGTIVSQYVTATGFKTPSGTSTQLLKANGATISYTTTAPSSSSTDNEIPTSKAVWSSIGTALTSALKYKGTLGTGGTITSLPTATSAYIGYVYVVKTAGEYAYIDVDINGTNESTSDKKHLEPGDYVIGTYNGSSYVWSAINGENQITNYGPASTINGTAIIPASGSGNVRIANVDGTDITLSYSHGAPTAAAGSKLSKDASGGAALAANTALQVVTGVDISRDANGHVTALDLDSKSITIPSIPNGFANVIAGTDITDNSDGTTTKTNAAADTTTDTLTVIGGNKWITTGSTDTSNDDKLFINHKRWKTADGSIVANASGATAAWSIDVVKGVTLSYDAAGHVGGLTVTSGKIPDPASTLYWANMNVQTAANYIKEPEFKTVKINGSSTNAASTNNCVLQYDTTNKCLNFVFN